MNYVNGAVISPSGRVLVSLGPTVSYYGGLPYAANGGLVIVLGVPQGYNAGIPYRGTAICVVANENAGPLPGWEGNSGFPAGPLGRLILSRNRPVAGYVNGWPIASNGAIAAGT